MAGLARVSAHGVFRSVSGRLSFALLQISVVYLVGD